MTFHPIGLERQSPEIHISCPAGFTRYELTMSGAALGWGLIVHHVTVHAFFHIALRFVLKIGGMLMGKVTEMVKSLKNMSGPLASELKELSTLALVTVAVSIQGPVTTGAFFVPQVSLPSTMRLFFRCGNVMPRRKWLSHSFTQTGYAFWFRDFKHRHVEHSGQNPRILGHRFQSLRLNG